MGGKILEEKFCGVWGQMREEFLKEKEPELYKSLVETKELEKYLEGYQRLYSNCAEKIQEDVRAVLAEEIFK